MPFLPFVYGYPSSSPHAHCTPNKSVPTLRFARRHGLIYIYIYTGYACRHLPSAVPWISDRLLVRSLQGHFLSPRSCPPKLCWLSALSNPACTTVRGRSQFTSSHASTYPEPRSAVIGYAIEGLYLRAVYMSTEAMLVFSCQQSYLYNSPG